MTASHTTDVLSALAGLAPEVSGIAERLAHERAAAEARRAQIAAELTGDRTGLAIDGVSQEPDRADLSGAKAAEEFDHALLDDIDAHLAEIVAAEVRLAEGTYGTCETCGHAIAVERLEVLPWARRCVHCAGRP